MVTATTESLEGTAHAAEIARGARFEFGRNWQQFLRLIDETRVRRAEQSLTDMLGVRDLQGRTFLDIGCGSGLFSLAARRLGARVHSFDFDPQSVACARELRRRYFVDDANWSIGEGSVLDDAFMARVGTFDVVYSWGVLHHTGRMWDAIDRAARAVAPGGALFIAIYNDLGTRSARWRWIKRAFNRLPRPLRPIWTALAMLPEEAKTLARALLTGRPGDYLRAWKTYDDRGMNRWRDMVDWVGGYPYEVATPEQLFRFCRDRGFSLTNLHCGGVGLGCNELVFSRSVR